MASRTGLEPVLASSKPAFLPLEDLEIYYSATASALISMTTTLMSCISRYDFSVLSDIFRL